MGIRGLRLKEQEIEFTFREVDFLRLNDWLLLCDHLKEKTEKGSETATLSALENFLMEIDFKSEDVYEPSKNRDCVCATYSMESFSEGSKALLNESLYYLLSMASDMRLNQHEKKTADELYKFMEFSMFDKTMAAFEEVDSMNNPIEFEEGEEFATRKLKNAIEKTAEELKEEHEKEVYSAEISF